MCVCVFYLFEQWTKIVQNILVYCFHIVVERERERERIKKVYNSIRSYASQIRTNTQILSNSTSMGTKGSFHL